MGYPSHQDAGSDDRQSSGGGAPRFLRPNAGDSGGERPSIGPATAQALIFVFVVMFQELYMLFPDMAQEQKWMIYGFCQEVTKAVLCMVIGSYAPRLAVYGFGAAVWFTTQAYQEINGQNEWITETWEYSLLAVYFIAMVVHTALTRSK